MSSASHIEGGFDTTYMSAAEQDRIAREQRQATARRYLARKGLDVPDANGVNLAEILGLVESAPPKRKVRRTVRGEVRPANPAKES